MRQRTLYRNKGMNDHKWHLWRLPDLDEPLPSCPGHSKDAILICPIMEGGNNGLIGDHIVRSACWALRSWLKFSDAIELDIPMKLYVEDSPIIKDEVLGILADNFIPEKNVLWYDGSNLDSSKIFSKKHAIYNDPQFANYKWVYAIDADMFLASQSGKKYNFFERLIPHDEEIGIAEIHHGTDYVMMNGKYYYNRVPADEFESVIEWMSNLKELTGPTDHVSDRYWNEPTSIVVTKMPIIAFPARHFLNNRKSDCEWLIRAGNLLGHDEETMSVWDAMGNPLWDISKEVGLPVHWWTGMAMDDKVRRSDVYMSHAASMELEYKWRKDIDAL